MSSCILFWDSFQYRLPNGIVTQIYLISGLSIIDAWKNIQKALIDRQQLMQRCIYFGSAVPEDVAQLRRLQIDFCSVAKVWPSILT
jgi:hypothetical protein